jgi:hypothetical protein
MAWPQIIAEELDIPLYNFGKSGAGNMYIHNTLMQADARYKFDEDDLIMICWTTVAREDRWIKGAWRILGNIYTQTEFDDEYIFKYADDLGYLIRDIAFMHSARSILNNVKCQYHMMSMNDVFQHMYETRHSQFDSDIDSETLDKVVDLYKIELLPSFFKILWDHDVFANKRPVMKKLNENFRDAHPSPIEHLSYLSEVYEEFSENTIQKVNNSQKLWEELVKKYGDIPTNKHRKEWQKTYIRSSVDISDNFL